MHAISARLAIALVALCWGQTASAQTADEVVEKSLTALGGRAALGKLTSRTTVGTMTLFTPAGEVSGPVEVFNEQPNKSRTLIKVDLTSLGAGPMVMDQRFDGTSGYVLDNLRGNRDITGPQLEGMKNSIFPTPLMTYKEHGAAVELDGKDKIGTREAYVLIFKPKSGPVVRQFVDAESYLPVKVVAKVDVPQVGEVEQTTELSDYREVDGIKIPFSVKVTSAIQSFTIAVTKIEHNTKLDGSLFSKPAEK